MFCNGVAGFYYTSMGRPLCENEEETDHWNTMWFMGTVSGWKADHDAKAYEIFILVSQLIALVLESVLLFGPVVELLKFIPVPGSSSATQSSEPPRTTSTQNSLQGQSKPSKRSMVFFSVGLLFMIIGAVILIVSQSVSSSQFGSAWADGIVGKRTYTTDAGVERVAFNAKEMSSLLYDQVVITATVTAVSAFLIGGALQRYLLIGTGNVAAFAFVIWATVMILFGVVPMIAIYRDLRSLTDPDSANSDCRVFESNGYDWSHATCKARFWCFVVGCTCLYGVAVFMLITGIYFNGLNLFCKRRHKIDTADQPAPPSKGFNSATDPSESSFERQILLQEEFLKTRNRSF